MSVRWVAVWCFQRTGGPLELCDGPRSPLGLPRRVELDHPVIERLRRTRGFLQRTEAAPAGPEFFGDADCSCLVSLFAKGRVVGVLALGPRHGGDHISPGERDVLMLMANQIAVAVDHAAIHRDHLESEKLALIGRMAAGLAHEVRNPLGAIRGAAQLLGDELPEGSRRFVRIIDAETQRLDTLVRKFLAMARREPPALAPVELSGLLARIIEAHRADPASARVRVHVAGASRPSWVLVDADGLVQIVVNLLVNARDAVEGEGEIWLCLSDAPVDGRVRLTVRDSGPGIARSIADALFEPFSTTKPSGTGLGLALSRQVARSMGADLELGPGGAGAVFHLDLARAARTPEPHRIAT